MTITEIKATKKANEEAFTALLAEAEKTLNECLTVLTNSRNVLISALAVPAPTPPPAAPTAPAAPKA